MSFDTVRGYATQNLPSGGKFNYVGEALSQDQTGRLNYTVDFAAKTGSGFISDIAGGISLNEGRIGAMSHTNPDNTSISGYGISSTAHSNNGLSSTYKLGFFGPEADEIVGVVTSDHGDVGFGGKKQ
ncbi:factor H binding protein domain-containing protein [Neisseria weixii]|uniref:factor H binding protein domain-containing protein n=1 Tax=Neisseria weixii TaxID=1853276 RepID=UPI0013153F6C|nr:factor H binding protein domain-containing protein [Neisseria weixii]